MVEGAKLNEAKAGTEHRQLGHDGNGAVPVIGYDKAAAISYYAIYHGLALNPLP